MTTAARDWDHVILRQLRGCSAKRAAPVIPLAQTKPLPQSDEAGVGFHLPSAPPMSSEGICLRVCPGPSTGPSAVLLAMRLLPRLSLGAIAFAIRLVVGALPSSLRRFTRHTSAPVIRVTVGRPVGRRLWHVGTFHTGVDTGPGRVCALVPLYCEGALDQVTDCLITSVAVVSMKSPSTRCLPRNVARSVLKA